VVNGTDVTDYDYDAVGNLVNTILPNGVIETRGYDSLNRLLNLETKKGVDTLTGLTYTLSPTGMRTSVTEQDGRKVEYKYDSLYRLTEEKITDAVNGNRTTTYSMDAVGNRTSKVDSVDGTTTYVYDANDRIISDGTSTYTYDARGNTISVTKGTDVTVNTWDDKGRLVKVVITSATGTKVLEYQYDENNIRVSQKVDGIETRFLVDSNTSYTQVLEEYNPINGTIVASYIYGLDLISQQRGGVKSFYIYDGLGSTRALTNSDGAVTDRYNYDAYGNLLNSFGTTSNNYRFTGEQFDPNLGDYYLRDRYYGTDIGRFTRADTFSGNNENPISLNLYTYSNNNPISLVDPSGFMAEVLTVNSEIQRFYGSYVAAFLMSVGAGVGVGIALKSYAINSGTTAMAGFTPPDPDDDCIVWLNFAKEVVQEVFQRTSNIASSAPGTLERNNYRLSQNMNVIGGVPNGYAAHHLIPIKSAQSSDMMKHAASIGYDINRARNGIALPSNPLIHWNSGLPLHQGGHLGEYFAEVDRRILQLEKVWKNGSISDQSLLKRIGKIEDGIRRDLISRTLKLQDGDTNQIC
jgi:RHS repeat-associated protein